MKMPETEAETRAQVNRMERKLAAPVHCTDCDWTGKCGALRATHGLRCPMCGGARIVWIESPTPEMKQ